MIYMMPFLKNQMSDGLSRANELGIQVQWRQIFDSNSSEFKSLIFDSILPLEIELKQDKNKIQCILKID